MVLRTKPTVVQSGDGRAILRSGSGNLILEKSRKLQEVEVLKYSIVISSERVYHVQKVRTQVRSFDFDFDIQFCVPYHCVCRRYITKRSHSSLIYLFPTHRCKSALSKSPSPSLSNFEYTQSKNFGKSSAIDLVFLSFQLHG